MRAFVLATALLCWASSTAATDAPPSVLPKDPAHAYTPLPANCPRLTGEPTARPGEPLKPRKLTELPQAKAYHTVFRRGPDGCLDPLFVGYQYRLGR